MDATPGNSADMSRDDGSDHEIKMLARDVNVYYGDTHAIKNASVNLRAREILAFMGPSGCGKSTFLRCFNRMNDSIPVARTTGTIELEGVNIYDRNVDPAQIRARVGMVAQAPNPFPKSIFDNVAFGPRINGFVDSKDELREVVETALKQAALWDEVKDDLKQSGISLSGGQQQRLCIARAIANRPEVILMDEPASALDPRSTAQIESLIKTLAESFSIAIVTHNMQEARRVADRVVFMHLGEIVEVGSTRDVFEDPQDKRTQRYLRGEFAEDDPESDEDET